MPLKKTPFLFPGLITLVIAVLFFKTFIFGLIPIPADLLVGAYYPWLSSKWGYTVGVPVKNPIISDVFSQFYPWKILVADAYRHFTLPLWNPYSFSGYPLLATLHSGALYPVNLLFVLLGNIPGWSWFLIFGTLGSALNLYFLSRVLGFSKLSSAIAAITYSCSGFAITWMQFATATQAMVWLPLAIAAQERFYQTHHRKYLTFLPFLIFLLVTSGHFQTVVYSLILMFCYHLFRQKTHYLVTFSTFIFLGLSLSAIQLIPSFELLNFSIRTSEHYISQNNFGLLPLANLVTLVAPDYFGNPTRANHWGTGQYHETLFYAGIFSAISLIFSLYYWHNLGKIRFFLIASLLSLAFAFDTPLGRAVYALNIPLLSTSYASRIFVIFTFATAILTTYLADHLFTLPLKTRLRYLWPLIASLLTIVLTTIICRIYLTGDFPGLILAQNNLSVSLRNLTLPGFLSLMYILLFTLPKSISRPFLFLLVTTDLLIFAWRYLPFVKPNLIFPKTPEISYLASHLDSNRLIVEPGEILPSNTWTPYQFRSPTGYDPMLITRYYQAFSRDINAHPKVSPSRYLEPEQFPAQNLGRYAVKYLLALKRDPQGSIPGDSLNYKIDTRDWIKVYETPSVAILQNQQALPRARLDSATGSAKIITDSPQKVVISYFSPIPTRLILADTWYPGWKATVNGRPAPITDSNYPFRTISIPQGSGTITFTYLPLSLLTGLFVSIITSIVLSRIILLWTNLSPSKNPVSNSP